MPVRSLHASPLLLMPCSVGLNGSRMRWGSAVVAPAFKEAGRAFTLALLFCVTFMRAHYFFLCFHYSLQLVRRLSRSSVEQTCCTQLYSLQSSRRQDVFRSSAPYLGTPTRCVSTSIWSIQHPRLELQRQDKRTKKRSMSAFLSSTISKFRVKPAFGIRTLLHRLHHRQVLQGALPVQPYRPTIARRFSSLISSVRLSSHRLRYPQSPSMSSSRKTRHPLRMLLGQGHP